MRPANNKQLPRVPFLLCLCLLLATSGLRAAESVPALATGVVAANSGQLRWDTRPDDTLLQELETYLAPEIQVQSQAIDLLSRLRTGFTLEPVMNRRVQTELDWFLRNPTYVVRVFERAQRYMPYIADELEARGLPLELALLPIVESAYDPFAYSHGRAAGLWQIIPGTATRFGIRQNWWYDGRRDVVDSTAGALSYLQYLNELMDGDWLLAVASYNAGEGNIGRSLRRNRAAGKPTDFWNLTVPKETSAYVPRLLALVTLVRDPAALGITLPDLQDEPQFVTADVGGQLDLALAAELAGLDVDTLYAYNAGFNNWATDPAGPHRLVLPIDVADDFGQALAAVPDNERLRWQRHKIRPGETLSGIATTYHTTIAAIRNANGISGNTIRAGQHITVPIASKPLDAYSKSAAARRETTQNRERDGTRVEHHVRAGESFWSIGRRYGVTTRQVAAWNAMAPRDTLSIGQKLVVWTKGAAPAGGPMRNATTRKLNYTVRRGDSLYLIASRFRVTVSELVRWNNIDKNNILRPGQKLMMYVDVTQQSS
ncbi:MAG: LysM peptidoglycan-binding domain-containing protein [Woeseia sp.]